MDVKKCKRGTDIVKGHTLMVGNPQNNVKINSDLQCIKGVIRNPNQIGYINLSTDYFSSQYTTPPNKIMTIFCVFLNIYQLDKSITRLPLRTVSKFT